MIYIELILIILKNTHLLIFQMLFYCSFEWRCGHLSLLCYFGRAFQTLIALK